MLDICQDTFRIEILMNEMQKNQKIYFDLQIHPTLLNIVK